MTVGVWSEQLEYSYQPPPGGEGFVSAGGPAPNTIVVDAISSPQTTSTALNVTGTYTDATDTIVRVDLLRSNDGGSTFPTNLTPSGHFVVPSSGVFSIPTVVDLPANSNTVYKVLDTSGHAGLKAEGISNTFDIQLGIIRGRILSSAEHGHMQGASSIVVTAPTIRGKILTATDVYQTYIHGGETVIYPIPPIRGRMSKILEVGAG